MPSLDPILRKQDTIVALSTPPGVGALALIRLSGKESIVLCQQIFKGKDLREAQGHSAHFGSIIDESGKLIDEVVLTVFRSPRSFTKEDVVEISCHGSDYIIQQIIQLLLVKGARLALPGEFSQRAYLNGQMDLAQAEAIADLIASDSEAAHKVAMQQMRGGYSQQIKTLREDFIRLAALLELELDFSEEDVEFANRDDLWNQVQALHQAIAEMIQSFTLGNAIKNGVPVAIIGKPNAGKSTLLNALLREERAIVSAIPGTTRDTIEDERVIEGIRFRFIDTAGLRETQDEVESIGIERTRQKMKMASLLLYLFDAAEITWEELQEAIAEIKTYDIPYLLVANKIDLIAEDKRVALSEIEHLLFISALQKENLDNLEKKLAELINLRPLQENQVIVTNLRHYENLKECQAALTQVSQSLQAGLSTELIASDMREAAYFLGQITGEISNDDLLEHIFSKFCIGK